MFANDVPTFSEEIGQIKKRRSLLFVLYIAARRGLFISRRVLAHGCHCDHNRGLAPFG